MQIVGRMERSVEQLRQNLRCKRGSEKEDRETREDCVGIVADRQAAVSATCKEDGAIITVCLGRLRQQKCTNTLLIYKLKEWGGWGGFPP